MRHANAEKTTVIYNEKVPSFLKDFISNFDYDYFDSIYKLYKKKKKKIKFIRTIGV